MVEPKPWPEVPVGNKDHMQAALVIIGAGMSGLCMAIDLIKRSSCRNFVIIEKGSGCGGTWRENKYPGCCCDIWSHLYSFSFEQNPYWTRTHPGQEELQEYLENIARKWDLFRHMRLNTVVETTVRVAGEKDREFVENYTISFDFLVSAYPTVPGMNDFEGKSMHSARWDWSYDLRGKRVAVIGNGASAVQLIPEVAKCPPYRWRKRAIIMDSREEAHEGYYNPWSLGSQFVKDQFQMMLKRDLPHRPDLWDKLTPKYSPGCKRIIFSDDWFKSFANPRVHLETRHISRVTNNGIEVEGGDHQEFDLVVYFGITVESLPNFGMLYGPNTNLGHNSVVLMIEAQSRYIAGMVKTVLNARRKGKTLAIKPEPEIVRAFNAELQNRLGKSTFADPNCSSWYKTKDGRITNNWSGTVVEYQKNVEKVKWNDYVVEGSGADLVGEELKIGRVVEETQVSKNTIWWSAVSLLFAGTMYTAGKFNFLLRTS
ncbi:cyclohexanone monooxygenase [Phyllosticta citriasiana]|uniref:cyclohexanone monooxygenase n=1 Tax=Phyllosticta citriasiana TaxID=595635 RepID=UPI0030FD4D7C